MKLKSKSAPKKIRRKPVREIPVNIPVLESARTNRASLISESTDPVPEIERPSKQEIVGAFLRSWAVLNGIDYGTNGDNNCNAIMNGIVKHVSTHQPSRRLEVKCSDCGTPAPFLTILGIESGAPLLCLKCQGVKDLVARVQARILPLKSDTWGQNIHVESSS